MWDTFVPDLLVAFIGALLTVAIAYITFLLQQRRNESQALRGLIVDLHHRRAVAVAEPVIVPNSAELPDYQRANLSVIDIRDHVRRVRDQVRQDSPVQYSLSKMIRSCNLYLEDSATVPDRYTLQLRDLRDDLHLRVLEIAKGARGVTALEPGAAAF